MKVYVAVQWFRKGDDVACLGVWKSKKKAVAKLKKTLDYVPEFSDPDGDTPFFGTEEWSVWVKESELDE